MYLKTLTLFLTRRLERIAVLYGYVLCSMTYIFKPVGLKTDHRTMSQILSGSI